MTNMEPNFYIETPRLILSHFDPDLDSHCDLLIDFTNDPNIHIENGSIGVLTPDRSSARQEILRNKVKDGHYIVSLKTPDTTTTLSSLSTPDSNLTFAQRLETYPKIGTVSMKIRKFEGAPKIPDLGFTFLTKYTGKGYATEAAVALTKYYQEEKGHTQFLGYCHPENESSKKMFRRMGWQDMRMRELNGLVAGMERPVRGWVWALGITENELDGVGVMP